MYSVQLYTVAFQQFQMGYAAAMAWILFVIIFVALAAARSGSPTGSSTTTKEQEERGRTSMSNIGRLAEVAADRRSISSAGTEAKRAADRHARYWRRLGSIVAFLIVLVLGASASSRPSTGW